MLSWVFLTSLLAFASSKPCENEVANNELFLSLNKNLLRSLETEGEHPNPSVHLALRISDYHNLAKESEQLIRLGSTLHNDLQNSLTNRQAVTGHLALYALALKSSCFDLHTVSFSNGETSEMLLTHLKRQMEEEKVNIHHSGRPSTNYYQYSLGVLALCTSSVKVDNHVTNKLIKAVEHQHFTHGGADSIDTYAMAGMALQCVKNSGFSGHNVAELDVALGNIKQKLLSSRRADGHLGNQFSTGLAVQALVAMGSPVAEYASSIEAIRTDARRNVYHNPMGISQILPALQQKSYLMVKNKECLNEDNTLVLETIDPVVVLPSETKVTLKVEVVKSSGSADVYTVDVPKDSSLLTALEVLQRENAQFTFASETSMWGPFLSVVNGEQARKSDRRYWHLSSDDTALTEGLGDFKIQKAQKITIKNTTY